MPSTRRSISRALARLLALVAAVLLFAAPRGAQAFCGFYVSGSSEQLVNRATRVALMRQGLRTVLTMSNDYQGPPQDFAMVVPVPVVLREQNVRTLPHDVFEHLESLTAPRLVEYWEQDPCPVERENEPMAESASMPSAAPPTTQAAAARDLGVRVEAQFTVGEYQVVVLSATQSDGLETWLREHQYNIPPGAAAALAPYVRDQWKFFVARIDIERVQRRPNGSARLSPLRFHYDSPEFRLPVRLGLLNAPDAQDLLVWVLSPTTRFELANYANAFIPTNLTVSDETRRRFPEFYAQLFDQTIAAAGGRAVVTEYAWATSSCDPCPTPPLEPRELVTLGGDVLEAPPEDPSAPPAPPSLTPAARAWNPYNMVVTRLHTRYNRATLTEDLVFREAGPVAGGRELGTFAPGGGNVEQGASTGAGQNNFQARYAIRHAWTGAIACANPRRGVWGGPTGHAPPPTTTARDLAEVARGRVDLASMTYTAVPALRVQPRTAFPWNASVRTERDLFGLFVAVALGLLLVGAVIRMARLK